MPLSPWTLQTADLQPRECQSSFVVVAFIYLLVYFTSLYSYCDTAVGNRKVFVGTVLIYSQHLTDTKHPGSAGFGSNNVVFVNYFEVIVN